jgi:hypothetical protein
VDVGVVLAGPVARDGHRARPDRGRERRVDTPFEIEGRAPVGVAVRLEPGDPRRVGRVRVELVMAVLAEPRGERLQRGPGVGGGVGDHHRLATVADGGIAGHATVALEDHPGSMAIDVLAGLLRGHRGPAGPGGVLGEGERDEVGTVSGRGRAKHRAHLRAWRRA